MPSFRIEVCTEKHDLKMVVAVINAAYRKHWYLQRERIRPGELIAILSHPKKKLYLCVSSENKVCGTLLLDLSQPGGAELYLLSVDPVCQGNDLGAFLMEYAEKEAFEKYQAKRVVLDVVKMIKQLVSYYLKRGYKPIGELEFPDMEWVKPEYRDQVICLLMEKTKE